ncbi:hypothetical protein [Halovulum marinum]|uniref:hypothetical protein n=1 Tax=Halovulum marinum TaxID=2662447 RepID=UPI001F3A03A2|nr:hypothetical protein [Halovulum marinum]
MNGNIEEKNSESSTQRALLDGRRAFLGFLVKRIGNRADAEDGHVLSPFVRREIGPSSGCRKKKCARDPAGMSGTTAKLSDRRVSSAETRRYPSADTGALDEIFVNVLEKPEILSKKSGRLSGRDTQSQETVR